MQAAKSLLFAILLLWIHQSSWAKETVAPMPGSRVRVESSLLSTSRLTGLLIGVTADSIRFQPEGRDDDIVLARWRLQSFEVSRGVHRRTLKGAMLGLLVGGAIGAGIGATSDAGLAGTSTSVLLGSVGLGALGCLVGTGTGYTVQSESWSAVRW